jgi:hypothetical protein
MHRSCAVTPTLRRADSQSVVRLELYGLHRREPTRTHPENRLVLKWGRRTRGRPLKSNRIAKRSGCSNRLRIWQMF